MDGRFATRVKTFSNLRTCESLSPQLQWRVNPGVGMMKQRSFRSGCGSPLHSMGSIIVNRSNRTSTNAEACRKCPQWSKVRNMSCGALRRRPSTTEGMSTNDDEFWRNEFADAQLRFAQAKNDYESRPWEIIDAKVEAELKAKWAKEAAELVIATERATEAVTAHLLAQGETEGFANRVLASMKERDNNWLLNTCVAGIVKVDVLNVFCEEIKQSCLAEAREALTKKFPTKWHLTELQKVAVINRILNMSSSSELAVLKPDLSLYAEALLAESRINTATFHCPVCMEPLVTKTNDDLLVDTSKNWFAPYRKTEHWVNNPCGHTCCRSCMKTWVETAIDEHKLRIKCPAASCSYSLWQQDIQQLVSKKAFKRHQEHTNADYLERLKACVKDDAELKTWLHANARPCPSCHVIVSRSEGCDAMMCVCGTRFCYKCGCKQCKCGKEEDGSRPDICKQCKCGKEEDGSRPDIWNP